MLTDALVNMQQVIQQAVSEALLLKLSHQESAKAPSINSCAGYVRRVTRDEIADAIG